MSLATRTKSRFAKVRLKCTVYGDRSFLLIIAIISAMVSPIPLEASAMIKSSADSSAVYVSVQGNDSWSGLLPNSNSNSTDGPFRTLQAAVQKINRLNNENTVAGMCYEVVIRGGDYYVPDGVDVHFASRRGSRLEIRNYTGEFVTITGGVRLKDFIPLHAQATNPHLRAKYADDVYVCDLKKAGIYDYGKISERGHPPLQVFFGDSAMTLARYPNKGWLTIAGVPQTGPVLYNLGLERERRYDGIPVGRNFGKINFPGDRPADWNKNDHVYVHGYWTWDWFDSYKKVDSMDLSNRTLSLLPAADPYGYTKGQRFYFLNVPEELDTPGEWYLDDSTGLLYFWPPRQISEGQTTVSVTDAPLLRLSGCSRVTVSGIYFDISRGDGVVIEGGSDNAIQGCLFRNIGAHAVEVNGGHNNGISNSILSEIGLDAVIINGGDRETLAAGRNYAINNDIDHFGTWLQTVHGVILSGVGDIATHNEIFDAPFEGLYLSGNNHLVAYNDFHDICRASGDAGALHTGRDWTWRGNVIKYNYFHDLKGPGLHGVMGVYLDDWATGFTVYGNVFDRADHAVFIGGGRDNLVENNVFLHCEPSVSVDGRGFSWASYYFNGAGGTELFDKMLEVKYREDPYRSAYPKLATLSDDDPASPSGNVIVRNVSCDGRWMEVHDFGTFDMNIVKIKDNVIADPELLKRRLANQVGWDPYYLNLQTDSGYVVMNMDNAEARKELSGNNFIKNSILARITNGRLEVSKNAFANGFKPIPFREIGTQDNHFRQVAEWLLRMAVH